MKRQLIFFVFLSLILKPTTVFSTEIYGVLMVVKGDVSVAVRKTNQTEKAKVGFKIFVGDTIVTGKDSRAKLVMIDKNIINISPDSKFVLEKYVYKPDEEKKSVSLNVLYGKVRSTVKQKYEGTNTFRVKTPSAVAGVRGTDFVVGYSETTKVSKVVTFSGKVEVGSGVDGMGRIMNAVFVTPGQYTVASVGIPPSSPIQMPKTEMAVMKDQTDSEKAKPMIEERKPSNDKSNQNGPPNGKLDLEPSKPHSMMEMMGEDAKRDVASEMDKRPPVMLIPANMPACSSGLCLPANINPEYMQGTTKLIINVQ